jgi:hypothetical protein
MAGRAVPFGLSNSMLGYDPTTPQDYPEMEWL